MKNNAESKDDRLKEAKALMKANELTLAIEACDKELEKNQNDSNIYILKGKIYIDKFKKDNDPDDLNSALLNLDKALQLNPQSYVARILASQICIKGKAYKKARSLLSGILKSLPNDEKALSMMAQILKKEGKSPEETADTPPEDDNLDIKEQPSLLLRLFDGFGFQRLNQIFQTSVLLALVLLLAYLFTNVESYLGVADNFIIGWAVFLILLATYRVEAFKKPPWRIFFALLAAFLGLRYIFWRTFETLIYTGPADLIGLSLLYLAECQAMIIHLLGMYISIWPIYRDKVAFPKDSSVLPTVDIMIPTYAESIEIVRITATASKQIDYPAEKLNIYILDDGGTVSKRSDPEQFEAAWERHYELRRMANELGINYITREKNVKAKAGNLNHAIEHTSGEIILFLDCDHVPTRDILRRTIGAFLWDKNLFLVQTPHFFINPPPVEKNLTTFSHIPVENDMFFRSFHPGLDGWNASYFSGSAALLRRKYLEEVGGISGNTITEDAETSLLLHSKGYNSIYIDRPMVCGLSPESFNDYVTQRLRWAQGMVQLLILNNSLFMKGLKLPQRLCYFNSSFFWFFSLSRFTFYIAPSLFLIFGLRVYHASIMQILSYALPFVLSSFLVADFFYGKTRQTFFSEIYESVQALFLMPAIISVIANPTKPTFKITPKGQTLDNDYLNPLASAFLLVVLINIVAIPLAVQKWFLYPAYKEVIVITSIWCTYNIFMALISLGAFWEKKQVRKHHRINVKGNITAFIPRLNKTIKGKLMDISLSGLGCEFTLPFDLIEKEEIILEVHDSYGEQYKFKAYVQRYMKKKKKAFCGTEFVSNKETFQRAVKFVYGDSQRWQDTWEETSQPADTPRILMFFFRMGIKGFFEVSISLSKNIISGTIKRIRSFLTGENAMMRRLLKVFG